MKSRPKSEPRWLLLIHQIPADPAYLRVKVGRRLARVGAAQLKNSVYVLPSTETCREDLSWIRREVVDGGGEATIFEATTLEGLGGEELERMFREARAADYEACAEKLSLAEQRMQGASAAERPGLLAELSRIEEQLAEIERIDFFPRGEAEALRGRILRVRSSEPAKAPAEPRLRLADHRGRTWVTRAGVKVDRVACAWLIRRYIDRDAKFRFVELATYKPRRGELRFDMPDAEFTHEGDQCSFEVLCKRFDLREPGVKRLGEVVHDLDVKDGRYGHPETEGVRVLIEGLIARHPRDEARIEAASALFDSFVAAEHTSAGRRKR